MRFDELDEKMRIYEQSLDQVLLPDIYMVARLDGRSFTTLTKEYCNFEAPFDERFKDIMVNTATYLMDFGFKVVYAYTESDEISLLFATDEDAFGRKVRKYNSLLAARASAIFSLNLGRAVAFDCRMIPLPNTDRVVDYFRWRQEDANRNALNSYCYWTLRKEGVSARKASAQLTGKDTAYKNELLFERGINYNDVPSWQKRGIGLWREEYQKEGYNPITKTTTTATRRFINVEYELPYGDAYETLIRRFV